MLTSDVSKRLGVCLCINQRILEDGEWNNKTAIKEYIPHYSTLLSRAPVTRLRRNQHFSLNKASSLDLVSVTVMTGFVLVQITGLQMFSNSDTTWVLFQDGSYSTICCVVNCGFQHGIRLLV